LQFSGLLDVAQKCPGLVQIAKDIRAIAQEADEVRLERLLVDGQPDPCPGPCVVRGRMLEAGGRGVCV
jgi:hypothetical protein